MDENRPGLIERADELKGTGDAARTAIAKEEAERILGHLAKHGRDDRAEALRERLERMSAEMQQAVAKAVQADSRFGKLRTQIADLLPFLELGERPGQGTDAGAKDKEIDKKGDRVPTKTTRSADRRPLKRPPSQDKDSFDRGPLGQKLSKTVGTGFADKEKAGTTKTVTRTPPAKK